jgi:hypothetical protein
MCWFTISSGRHDRNQVSTIGGTEADLPMLVNVADSPELGRQ